MGTPLYASHSLELSCFINPVRKFGFICLGTYIPVLQATDKEV